MAFEKTVFDYSQLKEKDKEIYNQLSQKDKEKFEKSWCAVQDNEKKLKQQKARMNKLTNSIKEKERKARDHHLIQVGATVEKYVKITDLEKFDTYIRQFKGAIETNQRRPHTDENLF